MTSHTALGCMTGNDPFHRIEMLAAHPFPLYPFLPPRSLAAGRAPEWDLQHRGLHLWGHDVNSVWWGLDVPSAHYFF